MTHRLRSPFLLGAALGASTAFAGLIFSRAFLAPDQWIFTLCTVASRQITTSHSWSAWSFAPEVVLPFVAYALAYSVGWARTRRLRGDSAQLRLQGFSTIAALALLAVALISPLCRMSAVLASAHMIQHVILVAIAPPLLWLGSPALAMSIFSSTPNADVRAVRFSASHTRHHNIGPAVASAFAYGAAIWLWHTPLLYQLALTSPTAHLAMLVSLLGVSLWFWRAVLDSPPAAFALPALLLFVTILHTGVLGALLTFSQATWYPLMAIGASQWGFAPDQDQQLAGLIMWIPMGAIYLVGALFVISRSLGRIDHDSALVSRTSR